MMATGNKGALRTAVAPTPMKLGIALIVVILLAGWALFNKNMILTYFKSGETIKIHFRAGAELVPYESAAKVSFVPVGVVTAMDRQRDGSAIVSVKVDDGTRDKLGSNPSAVVRPTTLLGGNYFVDLMPGGDRVPFHGSIPESRTALPVELNQVAEALQPSALAGAQQAISNVSDTLHQGGASALDQLAADAPSSLAPTGRVLTALEGQNPMDDLTGIVSGLESTARVLDERQGQLDDIVSQLTTTSTVLGNRAQDVATAVAEMPDSLRTARSGLSSLGTTLDKLNATSKVATPTARQLDTLLVHADPVLVKARPVVGTLDTVLTSLQPTVQQLVPAATGYKSVLDKVKGPVLNRVNGPVRSLLQNSYHGVGPYSTSGSSKPVYQELAYMFTNLDRVGELVDKNGQAIAFQPGPGAGSVGGLPISLEQLFTVLTNKFELNGATK